MYLRRLSRERVIACIDMYRGCGQGSLSSVKKKKKKTERRSLSRCRRYRCFEKGDKKDKTNAKVQPFARKKDRAKEVPPKCNIPRGRTISSEIEITFIEIRNALEEKKKKNLISADTSIFHGRRADIL